MTVRNLKEAYAAIGNFESFRNPQMSLQAERFEHNYSYHIKSYGTLIAIVDLLNETAVMIRPERNSQTTQKHINQVRKVLFGETKRLLTDKNELDMYDTFRKEGLGFVEALDATVRLSN